MPSVQTLSLAALVCVAAAQDASSSSSSTTSAPASMATGVVMLPADVENCHAHGTEYFCFAGEQEWEITSENAADYNEQDLTSCTAGTAEDEISCEAPNGSDVTLVREVTGEDHDEDHAESTHDQSSAVAVPTELKNCHAHEDGIYCFAGEDEWEITSENAAEFDGQNLSDCEPDATGNSTISCNAVDGTEVTLAAHDHSEEEHGNDAAAGSNSTTETQNSTTMEEESGGEEGAGSTLLASVGFSMVGLVLTIFLL